MDSMLQAIREIRDNQDWEEKYTEAGWKSQFEQLGDTRATELMALLRKELAKESGALASLGGAGEAVSRLLRGDQSFNHQSAGEALRLLDARAEHATIIVHGRRDLARVEHDGGACRPGDADTIFYVVDEHLQLAPVRKSNFSAPLVGAMASSFHATDAKLPT